MENEVERIALHCKNIDEWIKIDLLQKTESPPDDQFPGEATESPLSPVRKVQV